MRARVVITGAGAITPAGCGVDSYLNALWSGRVCISDVEPALTGACGVFAAGIAPALPSSRSSRVRELAEVAASEAVASAGHRNSLGRLGLVFASAVFGTREVELAVREGRRPRLADIQFGTATDELGAEFEIAGPQRTVATGCTAGIDALGVGYDQIVLGRADAMLIVAAEASLSPIVFTAFERIGALSKKNDIGQCSQPFGPVRDGFVLSEGAAAIVLENFDSAVRRGTNIIAEIRGWASVSNAFHMTSMRTDGVDLLRVLYLLENASKCAMEEVDVFDVHGTSTGINDRAEAAALRQLFGDRLGDRFVTAQKSIVGHSLGASNLIEIIGLAYMLCEQKVPNYPSQLRIDDGLGVPLRSRIPARPLINGVKLSSSFSGIHSCVALAARRPQG